jgi:hypothetical protein
VSTFGHHRLLHLDGDVNPVEPRPERHVTLDGGESVVRDRWVR